MNAPRPRPARNARQSSGGNGHAHDADSVFEILRSGILDRRLSPGMQLKEQPLADAFRVPRAVIRAALARLQSGRLAEHQPNRGVFVASPGEAEAHDIFAARGVVEAAIVECLGARRCEVDFEALEGLVARELDAYARGDDAEGLRLSVDFHRALAELAGNSVLRDFLEELLARTPLVLLAAPPGAGQGCARDEHAQILGAIRDGDTKAAQALMRAHVRHLEAGLRRGACPPVEAGELEKLLAGEGALPGL